MKFNESLSILLQGQDSDFRIVHMESLESIALQKLHEKQLLNS